MKWNEKDEDNESNPGKGKVSAWGNATYLLFLIPSFLLTNRITYFIILNQKNEGGNEKKIYHTAAQAGR